MSTYDNAPPREGWVPQPGRHCGALCFDVACPTCGEYVPIPPNITLGAE